MDPKHALTRDPEDLQKDPSIDEEVGEEAREEANTGMDSEEKGEDAGSKHPSQPRSLSWVRPWATTETSNPSSAPP